MSALKRHAAFPALGAALLLSACGNLSGAGPWRVSESNSGTSAATSNLDTTALNSKFTCPTSPNVVPDYDYYFDGSGKYQVCTNTENVFSIEIHGQTHSSNIICIFPVQVIDDSHIYTKPDLTTGAPLSQCVQAGSGGAYASFPDINFNAVFIVEKQDVTAMRNCLQNSNYYGCPYYSFGQFR